jgi:uncharacterized protein YecE (DUF72 family)
MVWSQLAGIRTPPIVTTDFLYVRFIGDRSIDEHDFGIIQKDRVLEMNKWAGRIKRVKQDRSRSSISSGKEISLAIVAANNHYAGFGPGTANMFRKMVGLSEVSWTDEMSRQQTDASNSPLSSKDNQVKKQQSRLTDFIE